MKAPIAWFAGFVLLLATVPVVGDNFLLQQATFVAMYCALAISWNLIGGYAGYPSFATAAFVGLGAYAGALLQNAGLPMVASNSAAWSCARPPRRCPATARCRSACSTSWSRP